VRPCQKKGETDRQIERREGGKEGGKEGGRKGLFRRGQIHRDRKQNSGCQELGG
jgi:hypothetical protein